jgi:SAM-dependent methyltransferase
VNYEIVKYHSTDVLGVAEALPFLDNSFDVVFSYAVLEHVKQPFIAAKEISRVLKPGGMLRVVVPFLQPLHGFPSHYFNMTQFGLKALFEGDLDIKEQYVRPEYGPLWTMHTLVRAWHNGLPAHLQKPFLNLTLNDFLVHPIYNMNKDFVLNLSEAANFEIASATGLTGCKPK